ncbi:hypothetical protein B566_EDAN010662 [Ephemera danica]|nr:hypothetical protein B566_EDAN010662 [Ephemera danica]
MARSLALVFLALVVSAQAGVLQVANGRLSINGQRVFLSGPNIAWYSYGYDFGNNQYDNLSGATLESWLQSIANAGGNSVRTYYNVYQCGIESVIASDKL